MGNMTIDIPQDYKGRNCNVHYLRDIVMDIVTSKGKCLSILLQSSRKESFCFTIAFLPLSCMKISALSYLGCIDKF